MREGLDVVVILLYIVHQLLGTMRIIPLLSLVLIMLQGSLAFAPFVIAREAGRSSHCLDMAKRTKLSFADKRKRRAKRLPPLPIMGKPVNFDRPLKEEPIAKSSTTPEEQAPPMTRAEEVLEAQRKSVGMLTLVRERVESLNYDDIQSSLETRGYFVVDDFLNNDDIVNELQKEGEALLRKDRMEVDLQQLGSGEYVCMIEGGEEQYTECPRSVELVVSATKHMSPAFEGKELNPSACMATMRTFDRKARLASLELLQGENKDIDMPERPFGIVATEENDARRISLLYYAISNDWQDEGGVTFEETGETIPAKRDRLLLLESETCRYRQERWKGKEGLERASSVELHLVKGSPQPIGKPLNSSR